MPATGTTTDPTGRDRCTAAPEPTLGRSRTQTDPLWTLQSMNAALAAAAPSGYARAGVDERYLQNVTHLLDRRVFCLTFSIAERAV